MLAEPLTEREREILALLADGHTNREIADRLYLAEKTIRWYNTQLFSKLDVSNRHDAVEQAQTLGLLDTTEDDNPPVIEVRHNLPTQTTPFVGRQRELADIADLLTQPDTRLLTILAPGGMGKTRLGLTVAEKQLRHFTDGVFFVPLAPLSNPDDIVTAIADSVGFSFYGGDEPRQQLFDYFRERDTLLLLDNFEHLLDGAPLVTDLLQAAPQVKVLATSREKLNLSGETVFTLSGLHFPDWETPDDALGYDAVKLFMQSAHRARPDFELQPDDLTYLARICHLTAGMPLGIVLAAGWLDMMSLERIEGEIQQGIDILETDQRDVPERQRSVRATFNYSWARLTDAEQNVFMKLSVFRGGFTPDAAEVVAGADMRALRRLVNKALVGALPDDRYDIHELLRQYGEDHLMASPDNVSEVRDLHCSYYATFLHERGYELVSGRQQETALELATDIENIRIAWSWACQYAKAKEIGQMVVSVYYGSLFLNLDVEALSMAEKAIRSLEAAETTEEHEISLAFTLVMQSVMAMRLGQIEKMKIAAERSCQLFETFNLYHQNKWGFDSGIEPRELLGILCVIQGNFAEAEALGEQMRRDYEASDKRFSLANALYVLTIAHLAQGKFKTARLYAQQAYTNAKKVGNRWFVAYILDEWGNTVRALGDYDEARELYQKSYDAHKDFDDFSGMGTALSHLANIALFQGKLSEAEGYYRQSVILNRDKGNRGGIAASLEGLGNAMLSQGDYEQAEGYLIEALHTASIQIVQHTLSILIGLGELWICTGQQQRGGRMLAFVLHDPASNQEIKDRVEQLKIKLGEEVDNVVWESGKQVDLEAMVEELLGCVDI